LPWHLLQIGVFGKVDDFQRQLDKVARLLDTDYDDALSEMVRGEWIAQGFTLPHLLPGCDW
jgi:hypothetical protein